MVVLKDPVLHTKFQGERSIGSREKDFERLSLYMAMVTILILSPGRFEHIFVSSTPGDSI